MLWVTWTPSLVQTVSFEVIERFQRCGCYEEDALASARGEGRFAEAHAIPKPLHGLPKTDRPMPVRAALNRAFSREHALAEVVVTTRLIFNVPRIP